MIIRYIPLCNHHPKELFILRNFAVQFFFNETISANFKISQATSEISLGQYVLQHPIFPFADIFYRDIIAHSERDVRNRRKSEHFHSTPLEWQNR